MSNTRDDVINSEAFKSYSNNQPLMIWYQEKGHLVCESGSKDNILLGSGTKYRSIDDVGMAILNNGIDPIPAKQIVMKFGGEEAWYKFVEQYMDGVE